MRLTSPIAAFLIAVTGFGQATLACPDCGCEVAASSHEHDHDHKSSHQDRNAILAMVGEYKVTFQFQETVATQPGYELREPYHSEATEFVEVSEDTGDFISLQQVLVLAHKETGEPRIVKHWRQDWTYQDTQLLEFRGNLTWENVEITPEQAAGTWSQAVYQVDDSPRYESYGKWVHTGERSSWESAKTWRPLPRREFSKRSDYQVLVARNRQTITPQGWVHEQDNHKLVLDEAGYPERVIAHESGLNVYQRVDDHDFTAGRVYWDETSAFWEDVREIWADTFAAYDKLTLKEKVDDKKLFAAMFALAKDVRENGYSDETRAAAQQTVDSFLLRQDQ